MTTIWSKRPLTSLWAVDHSRPLRCQVEVPGHCLGHVLDQDFPGSSFLVLTQASLIEFFSWI